MDEELEQDFKILKAQVSDDGVSDDGVSDDGVSVGGASVDSVLSAQIK